MTRFGSKMTSNENFALTNNTKYSLCSNFFWEERFLKVDDEAHAQERRHDIVTLYFDMLTRS